MKHEDKSESLLLGLTRENVKRLMSGLPMHISRKTHGIAIPEGLVIGIVYGEDQKAIRDELDKAGLIKPTTFEQGTPGA